MQGSYFRYEEVNSNHRGSRPCFTLVRLLDSATAAAAAAASSAAAAASELRRLIKVSRRDRAALSAMDSNKRPAENNSFPQQ